jgi:predicted CopG family antitoxin
MHVLCMATTTISLTTEAYQVLTDLKREGQSFSDVILENLHAKPRTCGELLAELERDFEGAKLFDPRRIAQVRSGRGRRSNRPPASR